MVAYITPKQSLTSLVVAILILVVGFGLAENVSAFEERFLTDENTFKNEIAKSGIAWVKYEIDMSTITRQTNNPLKIKQLGDAFWEILKKEFSTQVDSYIVVYSTGWSDRGEAADREIGKDFYPSFILYKDGKVVNDGSPNDIRIFGGVNPSRVQPALRYIRRNSFLK